MPSAGAVTWYLPILCEPPVYPFVSFFLTSPSGVKTEKGRLKEEQKGSCLTAKLKILHVHFNNKILTSIVIFHLKNIITLECLKPYYPVQSWMLLLFSVLLIYIFNCQIGGGCNHYHRIQSRFTEVYRSFPIILFSNTICLLRFTHMFPNCFI